MEMIWGGTLPDLLDPSNTTLVYGYGMNPSATDEWVEITFATPQQLVSFDRAMTAGSGNSSWHGQVVGIDAAGNQTSLGTSFPLIGPVTLQVNSPTTYKSYRFVRPNGTYWGNGPATIRWSNFIFA